jgi:hypothetical protein
MGATKIMVIRHAEKPATYNGQSYAGVDTLGATCGKSGSESLVTLGWQRAGALVTLFAPPWGPKAPILGQPNHIYACDPTPEGGKKPSQRHYQTVIALAAHLNLPINAKYRKENYQAVATDALGNDGTVLICWQQERIPLIARALLAATDTTAPLGVPVTWPTGADGPQYDLVWVFDRLTGNGPFTSFTQFAQMLLPGDAAAPE